MVENKVLRLVIIIPTFNRKYLVNNLLHQIFGQELSLNIKLFVVVVNDGSNDGTSEILQNNFPEVHVVNGNGSWWYTKSMNEGFKYAKKLRPDFVLTLNDDIEIKTNYINSLVNSFKKICHNSLIGSLSLTLSKPYRIVSSGNRLKYKNIPKYNDLLPFNSMANLKELKGIHETVILPGRGILIPYSILSELNFFDERFPQYHSDGDFCHRAKREGCKIFISWDTRLYVHLEKTASGSSFLKTPFKKFIGNFFNRYSRTYLPSMSLYLWRHFPKILWLPNMIVFIILAFRNFIYKPKLNV